jgi:hypothetical protein
VAGVYEEDVRPLYDALGRGKPSLHLGENLAGLMKPAEIAYLLDLLKRRPR